MATLAPVAATLASLERRVSEHAAQSESVKLSTAITPEAVLSGLKATILAKLSLQQRSSVRKFPNPLRGVPPYMSCQLFYFRLDVSTISAGVYIAFPRHLGHLIARSIWVLDSVADFPSCHSRRLGMPEVEECVDVVAVFGFRYRKENIMRPHLRAPNMLTFVLCVSTFPTFMFIYFPAFFFGQ